MKKYFFLITLIIFSLQRVEAATDKYRIILHNNPATSIIVAWNQISGSTAKVHYDVVDYGTTVASYTNTKTVDRSVAYRGMNNQFARLSGLLPNTNYYFVVSDDEGVSARYWFRTAPSDNSRLSFIAGGDSRNNRTIRQNANSLVAKLKPHAVFFGGDMINQDNNTEWQEWFDDWQNTIAGDGRMFPIVAVRGNHESSTSIYNLFDTATTDSYYAMTWGNDLIRTYALNSNISVTGNQKTWLQNDLEAHTSSKWKMIQYHHPMNPHTSGKAEGNHIYQAWSQLFYDNHVRVVVDCDSHVAKTTWPLKPSNQNGNDQGFIRDDALGTVYTGEGSWGAPLRAADDGKTWTRDMGSFNQFKLLFIDENLIEMRTVKIENVANVGIASNTDPFVLPANLVIWNPPSGASVVNILPPETCPVKGTACDDGDNNTLDDVEDGNCSCTGISPTGILSYSISHNQDDAEEYLSDGSVNLNSSDLEMVQENQNQTIGLRFRNIHLPQNATIDDAYIQFAIDESDNGTTNLTIYGELNVNPTFFVDITSNISSRSKTAAAVNWSNIPAWTTLNEQGVNQRTPNLKTLITEILQSPNWSSLNPMAFIITGSGKRVAISYNNDPALAPTLVITYTLQALPVTLVNFDVSLSAPNQSIISWRTETERNNQYFEIERSMDGLVFQAIGQVKGAGNSNTLRAYDFVDENPLSGNNYYRLKQVDDDGTVSYSDVRHLFVRSYSWTLFPNPATDYVQVTFAIEPEEGKIRIYNNEGRLLKVLILNPHDVVVKWSVADFPKGIYYVHIKSNHVNTRKKLIVE